MSEFAPDRRKRAPLVRLILLLPFAFLLSTFVAPDPTPGYGGPGISTLTAVQVPLDPRDPERRQLGNFLFLRGWTLESPDRRFGGISALHVADGRAMAVSDTGMLFRFPLPEHAGVVPLHILPLEPGESKLAHDSEAMAVKGNQVWIAYERGNRIARFDATGWRRQSQARPQAMRDWSANSGAEAIARLDDGRFLVFAEGGGGGPFSRGILFAGDPAVAGTEAIPFRYRRPQGFRVTDSALLPDGRLLLLHRQFHILRGFSARLSLADPAGIEKGTTLISRDLATLRKPLTVDNMEAVSVETVDGQTIVRLASDDNFMGMQRTLLLEFLLLPR